MYKYILNCIILQIFLTGILYQIWKKLDWTFDYNLSVFVFFLIFILLIVVKVIIIN